MNHSTNTEIEVDVIDVSSEREMTVDEMLKKIIKIQKENEIGDDD